MEKEGKEAIGRIIKSWKGFVNLSHIPSLTQRLHY